jgi:hypothetical protein
VVLTVPVTPVGVVLTASAALFTIDEGVMLLRGLASRSWSKTSGHLLDASTTSIHVHKGSMTVPVVRYEYEVGATRYEGDRVTFDGHLGIGLRVQDAIDRLRQAKHLDVWYDPAHPDRSVLEPGADAWNYGCTALGIFMTMLIARLMWLIT